MTGCCAPGQARAAPLAGPARQAATGSRSVAAGVPRYLQRQVVMGAVDDPLEAEAVRVADQVLAGAAVGAIGGTVPQVSRAVAGSCGACGADRVLAAPAHPAVIGAPLRIQRFTAQASAATGRAPESVDRMVASSGRPLEPALQHNMEQRFGHDFSRVRVHSDGAAEQSARDVNANAYTVGHDIVFGQGRYAPQTHEGQRLIAHELTHVVQQSGAEGVHPGQSNGERTHAPAAITVQRFADVDHHIIEEAVLKKVFTQDQLDAIEKGNTQRDYSQVLAFVNALLLGQMTQFGGYAPQEHFDNFVFDRASDRWVSQDEFDKIWDDRTRKWTQRSVALKAKPGKPRVTAPQYIEAQLLAAVQNDMPDASAFEHLGNAFHTIEDFFAHSNFVELTQRDYTFGEELTTHSSHAPGPGSEDSILGSVIDVASAEYFKNRFRKEQAAASPLAHGRLAKDFRETPNHALAITLAALVVRQVGLMLKEAFALKTRPLREEYVRTTISTTLSRYLRPPTDQDKWWESLLADDAGIMRRRIKTLQNKTPVTVNQTPMSPLRNIEATRFSPMKAIGMGTSLSLSIGDGKFLTVGHMLYLPGTGTTPIQTNLILPPYVSNQDEKVRLVTGFQFSGSFDETTWFGK